MWMWNSNDCYQKRSILARMQSLNMSRQIDYFSEVRSLTGEALINNIQYEKSLPYILNMINCPFKYYSTDLSTHIDDLLSLIPQYNSELSSVAITFDNGVDVFSRHTKALL